MAEDLESSTKAAWDDFERRLAVRLDVMEDDETLLVELPQDDDAEGATPYVQFCAWGDDMIRCEAVSNHYLADTWALTDDAGGELVTMGFSAPTYAPDDTADSGSSNYFVDVPRDEAFDLAWMTVVALRDVHGVPHPSLLEAEGIVEPAPVAQSEDGFDDGDEEHDCDPTAFEAHVVQGPAALQELVDETLEPVFGQPPKKDSDGDIPINTEHSVVWVAVNGAAPVIDVWGWVMTDVVDRALALHELAVLNRDSADVQFVLLDGRIVARTRVDALPFVPAHLRRAIDAVCTAVDRAHADLAPRFRAAAARDEDDE